MTKPYPKDHTTPRAGVLTKLLCHCLSPRDCFHGGCRIVGFLPRSEMYIIENPAGFIRLFASNQIDQ